MEETNAYLLSENANLNRLYIIPTVGRLEGRAEVEAQQSLGVGGWDEGEQAELRGV